MSAYVSLESSPLNFSLGSVVQPGPSAFVGPGLRTYPSSANGASEMVSTLISQ